MNQIAYIFGAGASKQALPIVNEIPNRINKLIDLLESEELQLDNSSTFDDLNLQNSRTKRDYQLEMIESLKWIMLTTQSHASVDTFAKKLYIKRNAEELRRLKIALSVFFIFEQVLNKPDPRYDTFFASLLHSVSSFPENVKILSWNYDYQFELTFSEYSDRKEIELNQSMLRVKSKYGDNNRYDGFGIYKLNGTTGFYSDGGWNQYTYANDLKVQFDLNFLSKVVRNFTAASYFRNLTPSLSFAWEPEHPEKSIINKAIENTSETDALVVIGYSFPFFNRDIDKKIIGAMKNLKRVYFQAPDADILKERFKAIRDNLGGIELVSRFDLEQFLLPNEL